MNENEILNENADDCGTVCPTGKYGQKGPVGICFDQTKKKYKAYVDVFGVRINLGSAFPTFQDAANARSNYLNKIFDSSSFHYDSNGDPIPEQYPLPKFLQLHFGLSSADSVRVPLACIKPYLDLPPQQRKVFPNFVVNCVKKGTAVPDCGSAGDRCCLTPAAASVIFGLYSFRLARLIFACRYEDIIQQMQDVVDNVDGGLN